MGSSRLRLGLALVPVLGLCGCLQAEFERNGKGDSIGARCPEGTELRPSVYLLDAHWMHCDMARPCGINGNPGGWWSRYREWSYCSLPGQDCTVRGSALYTSNLTAGQPDAAAGQPEAAENCIVGTMCAPEPPRWVANTNANTNGLPPECVQNGSSSMYGACGSDLQCVPGLFCGQGRCTKLCQVNDECSLGGGRCVTLDTRGRGDAEIMYCSRDEQQQPPESEQQPPEAEQQPAPEPSCGDGCDYCWPGTDPETPCPESFNGAGDGCDCGCQFVDSDCGWGEPQPQCGAEVCGGGQDEDCDGWFDWDDPDCAGAGEPQAPPPDPEPQPAPEPSCGDGCDYCWVGTPQENACPESYNGTGDGCDCGCQFADGDC